MAASLLALWLLAVVSGCSSPGEQERLHELLFRGVVMDLSDRDRSYVSQALDVRLGADGSSVVDSYCGQPIRFELGEDDLNGDGIRELVVQAGNACTSGNTGSTLWIFIREPQGELVQRLMAPAFGYHILPGTEREYPDLELGGPGFCHAIWRWGPAGYQYYSDSAETPGGCVEHSRAS